MDAASSDQHVILAMPIVIEMQMSPRIATTRLCSREGCETVLCTYNASTMCWSCHASAGLPSHPMPPALPDPDLIA